MRVPTSETSTGMEASTSVRQRSVMRWHVVAFAGGSSVNTAGDGSDGEGEGESSEMVVLGEDGETEVGSGVWVGNVADMVVSVETCAVELRVERTGNDADDRTVVVVVVVVTSAAEELEDALVSVSESSPSSPSLPSPCSAFTRDIWSRAQAKSGRGSLACCIL